MSGGNSSNSGAGNKYYQQSLSRASSTGSLHAGVDNATDDEDSDSKSNLSYRERRREAHTQAEQKRRDAIKKGYDFLQDLVPTCPTAQESVGGGTGSSSGGGYKVSKAIVLQKSIEYIQHVQGQKKVQEDELASLRKEVVALQIMRKNYEALAKAHKSQPSSSSLFLKDTALLPGEVKFQVFQLLMDSLFQSFNDSVNMKNFSELSGCVFSWLEEQCKPQLLQELMQQLLCRVHEEHQIKKDEKKLYDN
ncbi:MLX [Lepeophtheirus salmonis]|uniref:MLX n=1 Tax=Lepeophtheirus salmonis TaxID=72036 RepID=A0A7R8H8L6_LEPSM|nr:max-like protein X [Lepeophtheirus salmonis]CAB4064600.1 MLX [Lepeophtheirus salmonis]CAF2944061.1 MLX [Lepeophtheirus salmonis]